ncbi:carbon storage regulator, CsrA [Caldicellulosiruptor saccharolyticus DSM 8903]|uniref:Translational regulator CsrA n=1 Tax=Caldicellulosiruptor saccharolyticus (strain ATCC 43494 / DSM 8903 / Tp8T 6331) TaxID=351627 RepID=A4XK26_CALS8|nr:carbon storage regulator CsrA [Caldicellulosiruptor saccharolyticus]ABP67261.1 carbon storage regulator, CsrA [Caldicellulosiruptor saccharolyticus DSM 8903]
MLVLSRKEGDQILIGEDIIIKVISIEKDCVKLGIDAPKNVKVLRYELLQEVKNENVEALQGKERFIRIKDLKGLFKDGER